MRGHPGVQGVVVLLLGRPDRHQTWKVLGGDVAAQARGRPPSASPALVRRLASPQPNVSPHRCRWRPVSFWPPSSPRAGPPLRGLDRWALDVRRTRGRLAPCCHAGPCTPGLHARGPSPVVAPGRKVVLDRARGPQSRRPHVPLAPAPVQRNKRGEAFPPVDLTRVPAAWTRLGRRDQRCHDGPLFVGESRGILLSHLVFLQHKSALLC